MTSWLTQTWERLSTRSAESVPAVILAVALVLLGYAVARALAWLAGRLLRRWSARLLGVVDRISDRSGVAAELDRRDAEALAVAVTGRILFWLVFAVFLAAAAALVGFPVLSTWLAGFAAYLPRVLAAAGVLLLAVLAGHLARIVTLSAARSGGFRLARSLARAVHVSVVVVGCVIAVEQLGVEITFVIVLAATGLGVMLGGMALAFGLGARPAVENLVACHYLSRRYQIGHRVRIGDHEGQIVDIAATSVILETASGRVMVPAREFELRPSVLITGERAP
jgi:small-conductance mechanosensitive channel